MGYGFSGTSRSHWSTEEQYIYVAQVNRWTGQLRVQGKRRGGRTRPRAGTVRDLCANTAIRQDP